MSQSGSPHPMAVAMEWVAHVTVAGLIMVVPGLAGQWLDRRLGIQGFTFAGFAFGLAGGMAYILARTRAAERQRRQAQGQQTHATEGDESSR